MGEVVYKCNFVHCVILHDGVRCKALVNKTAEVRFVKGHLISEGPSFKNMCEITVNRKLN